MQIETLEVGSDASKLHLATRQALDKANNYLAPKRLRAYQTEIALGPTWTLSDPRDGSEATCRGSIYNVPKGFSYAFNSANGRFWVMTGPIAKGYPLAGIYYPEQSRCIFDPDLVERVYLNASLDAIVNARQEPDDNCNKVLSRLVLGHQNFAHFVWNELSALIEWKNIEPLRSLKILTIFEPIMPIETLLPLCESDQIARGRESDVTPRKLSRDIHYAFGSELVTLAAQKLVTQKCADQRHLDRIKPVLQNFCVWISLRELYRKAINEEQAIRNIATALLKVGSNISIILDGYSVPDDVSVDGRYDMSKECLQQEAVTRKADLLIQSIGPAAEGRIYDLCGADIATAIAAAKMANFYFCHHGTQQHKIGWLHHVPGIIHAGPPILETFPAGWVQAQAEGSLLPEYVPIELVAACASPDNPRQDLPYFADYMFSDIPALERFVVDRVSAAYAEWAHDL